MNALVDPFLAKARTKAAITLVVFMVASVLCILLADEKLFRAAHGEQAQEERSTSKPSKSSTGSEVNNSDALAVRFVAPPLAPPPDQMQTQLPKLLGSPDKPASPAPSPPIEKQREIDAREAVKLAQTDEERSTGDDTARKKPDSVAPIAVQCVYDFVAIQKSLETGRGILVALCQRTSGAPTLMVIDRSHGDTYELRKVAPSDNIANLGLRLASLEGDLAGLERSVRDQTGVESPVFYFAPSADFAQDMTKKQQNAIEDYWRTNEATGTGTIVLSARFFCGPDGSPTYIVTGIWKSSRQVVQPTSPESEAETQF